MMRRTWLALLLAAGLVFPAQGRDASGAEAFLRRVYAPYLAGDARVAPTGRAAASIFDDRLTRLIRRDSAEAKGEVGRLDHDPICDCQDFDRLKALSIRVWPSGPRSATARVRFLNGRTPVLLRYTLVRSDRGWRVADIRSRDMPSLAGLLGSRH